MVDANFVYSKYPRKVGKAAAIKAINHAIERVSGGEFNDKLMMRNDAAQFLLDKAIQFAQSPAGNRGQYTPHPATWFNRSSYLDNEICWYEQTAEERLQALNQVGVYIP